MIEINDRLKACQSRRTRSAQRQRTTNQGLKGTTCSGRYVCIVRPTVGRATLRRYFVLLEEPKPLLTRDLNPATSDDVSQHLTHSELACPWARADIERF